MKAANNFISRFWKLPQSDARIACVRLGHTKAGHWQAIVIDIDCFSYYGQADKQSEAVQAAVEKYQASKDGGK